jgi:hypothetical protein
LLQLLRAVGIYVGMTMETDMSAQPRSQHGLRTRPEAAAVDAWVRLALGQQFGETLTEEVPVDLAVLALRFGT